MTIRAKQGAPFCNHRRAGIKESDWRCNMAKDALDKTTDSIKKMVDDVKDAIHERQHRATADTERARRETLGDEMTGAEKSKSALNEAKERTKAEIDAAKREVRKHI